MEQTADILGGSLEHPESVPTRLVGQGAHSPGPPPSPCAPRGGPPTAQRMLSCPHCPAHPPARHSSSRAAPARTRSKTATSEVGGFGGRVGAWESTHLRTRSHRACRAAAGPRPPSRQPLPPSPTRRSALCAPPRRRRRRGARGGRVRGVGGAAHLLHPRALQVRARARCLALFAVPGGLRGGRRLAARPPRAARSLLLPRAPVPEFIATSRLAAQPQLLAHLERGPAGRLPDAAGAGPAPLGAHRRARGRQVGAGGGGGGGGGRAEPRVAGALRPCRSPHPLCRFPVLGALDRPPPSRLSRRPARPPCSEVEEGLEPHCPLEFNALPRGSAPAPKCRPRRGGLNATGDLPPRCSVGANGWCLPGVEPRPLPRAEDRPLIVLLQGGWVAGRAGRPHGVGRLAGGSGSESCRTGRGVEGGGQAPGVERHPTSARPALTPLPEAGLYPKWAHFWKALQSDIRWAGGRDEARRGRGARDACSPA